MSQDPTEVQYFKRRKAKQKLAKRYARGGLARADDDMPKSRSQGSLGSFGSRGAKGGLALYAAGGASTSSASGDGTEARIDSATNAVKDSNMAPGAGMTGESSDYSALKKSVLEGGASKKQVIDNAIQRLKAQQVPSGSGVFGLGISPQEGLRLAAALSAPSKTGRFGEAMGSFWGSAADIASERNKARDQITALELKGADVNADTLKQLSELRRSTVAQSKEGREASDAGLEPGTPEFNEFVRKRLEIRDSHAAAKGGSGSARAGMPEGLTVEDAVRAGGYFETDKTGKGTDTWIRVDKEGRQVGRIPRKTYEADLQEIDATVNLKNMINGITLGTVQRAQAPINVTSAGSAIGSVIGTNFATETAISQEQLHGLSLAKVLDSLPPGPASDADIRQAKGQVPPPNASPERWAEWIALVNRGINNYAEKVKIKYGGTSFSDNIGQLTGPSQFEIEYEQKYGKKPRNSVTHRQQAQQQGKEQGQPKTPAVGTEKDGWVFQGGDPSDKANWKRK